RRASISAARPWTRAARLERLALEDLPAEVVELLQRGGIEVDPAGGRQPPLTTSSRSTGSLKGAIPRRQHAPVRTQVDERDRSVAQRADDRRDQRSSCSHVPHPP